MSPTVALFDVDWYRKQAGHKLSRWSNPFKHYIRIGAFEGLDPNPYFSSKWYLQEYYDVKATGINPLVHYATEGFLEGRDPSKFFSTSWYLFDNADVRKACMNPLEHFLRHGRMEARNPLPPSGSMPFKCPDLRLIEALFDDKWYAKKYGASVGQTFRERFHHYLDVGAQAGYDPNPFLSSRWYLNSLNSDLGEHSDPLTHYFLVGASAGLNPSPLFDTKWYTSQNADVEEFGYNPLSHYLHYSQTGSACPNPTMRESCGPLGSSDYPRARKIPVSASFDPLDYVRMIPGYSSIGNIISGRHAPSFFDPDRLTWVLAPIARRIYELDSPIELKDLAVIGGFDGVIIGGSAVCFENSERQESSSIDSALLTRVSFAVAPMLPNSVHLMTDAGLQLEDRIKSVLNRIRNLPSCTREAVVLVENDFPEGFYFEMQTLIGSSLPLLRLRVGSLYRVRKMIIPSRAD